MTVWVICVCCAGPLGGTSPVPAICDDCWDHGPEPCAYRCWCCGRDTEATKQAVCNECEGHDMEAACPSRLDKERLDEAADNDNPARR